VSEASESGQRSKKIGILGGTFNPPHLGHLLVAEEALQQLKLDAIWIIPVAIPPHKSVSKVALAKHRLAMCKALFSGAKSLRVSDVEIRAGGKSYTYDTIVKLRRRYSKARFYFIVGSDGIEQIPTWYRFKELCSICQIVFYPRPDYLVRLPASFKKLLGHVLFNRLNRSILKVPQTDFSSNDIRRRIGRKKPVYHLTGAKVAAVIRKYRLYQSNPSRRKK